jgi:hypothetical protein
MLDTAILEVQWKYHKGYYRTAGQDGQARAHPALYDNHPGRYCHLSLLLTGGAMDNRKRYIDLPTRFIDYLEYLSW